MAERLLGERERRERELRIRQFMAELAALGPISSEVDSFVRPALERAIEGAQETAVARAHAELEEHLQPMYDVIVALAAMDLERRMPVTNRFAIVDAVATGLNMLAEEISARVAEERKLRARLMHADRLAAVGQLAAGVAHEVNNPATYIAANLDTLREKLAELVTLAEASSARRPDSTQGEWTRMRAECASLVDECADGMQRIVAVVKDLRTFSRLESEQAEAVSVDELLRLASRTVGKIIRYRGELVESLGNVPLTYGHRARLTQVFTNLLVNAAQALDERHPEQNRIVIASRVEGEEIVASISDTGPGIPAELHPRVFEPFFTTKSREVGTGLGLSLAAEIVRQHGGLIGFESAPGRGTRFEVRLPLRTPPPASPPEEVRCNLPGERRKLLVIDDEPALLRASARALRREFDVTTAASGELALELLAVQAFDAVLCDLMMPGIDGPMVYEAALRIDPANSERFFFFSGGVFTERARAFVERHAGRTFDKPIDFKRLGALVSNTVAPR